MTSPTEIVPRIYYPEDIRFRDHQPYLEIILGQLALELLLKNVGSAEQPVWIAWFDPREIEIQQAGTQSLIESLRRIDEVGLIITPASTKSGPMIEAAAAAVGITCLTLVGGYDRDQVQAAVGAEQPVFGYFPITSLETPKYLAFPEPVVIAIKATIQAGQKLVILDDVYSSGHTIGEIVGGLEVVLDGLAVPADQLEVVTVAREGVITNGEALPPLTVSYPVTFEIFIPKVLGDLPQAISGHNGRADSQDSVFGNQ